MGVIGDILPVGVIGDILPVGVIGDILIFADGCHW